MTTLTEESARRLVIAQRAALVLEEALTQIANPSEDDPLLAEHAVNMMLEVSGLVKKLKRLTQATDTEFLFASPLPEWKEFRGQERQLRSLVKELVHLVENPNEGQP